jgi:hypothetical protein
MTAQPDNERTGDGDRAYPAFASLYQQELARRACTFPEIVDLDRPAPFPSFPDEAHKKKLPLN